MFDFQRLFVISKFRVFILAGKSPNSLKVERSVHLLNVKAIQVLSQDEVRIVFFNVKLDKSDIYA